MLPYFIFFTVFKTGQADLSAMGQLNEMRQYALDLVAILFVKHAAKNQKYTKKYTELHKEMSAVYEK